MWPISKGINDGEVKCRFSKPNSTQRNLCEQLESPAKGNECKENRTRSQSTTNLYRSQEEKIVNMYRSNDNRNNISKSYDDNRVNQCMPDKNKNNMNTCYDEIRMNPKRFIEDSRHSTNKLRGYNPFESNQSSVKRSSKLKRREYMDSAAERVPEEFPQRNGQPRQLECNTGEQQQNRRQRQPTTPKPNISDDYKQDYYDGMFNTRNCQPNRNSQKQQRQNCHQNQEVTPQRQSYLDRVPSIDEYRMEGGSGTSSADVGRLKEYLVVDRKQGQRKQQVKRWQQPKEEKVNELQTDNIMARVEMQRLYSLQCIERHQRALVLEIQQLLKNEQEQCQLRITSEKQKVARSRRQKDVRCSQDQVWELWEPEEQEPDRTDQALLQQSPVREQYKPTPFVRQQYRPAQQANFRNTSVRKQPLSSPRRPVAPNRPQKYGDQMLPADYSTGTEDSNEEQRQQSMMCPSCSELNWPDPTAKPKQIGPCVPESTPQADSCSSFEFHNIPMSVSSTSASQAKRRTGPNGFATVQSPLRSKFPHDFAPDMIAGNDKIKKSASADDQSRRRNYTVSNESQREYMSPQDTISEYYLSTRKSTSSSSSAPCLQTQMSPLNRDGCGACPDRN